MRQLWHIIKSDDYDLFLWYNKNAGIKDNLQLQQNLLSEKILRF